MAHLMSNPFDKRSYFEFPQKQPLSPPDTNIDSPGTTMLPTPMTHPSQLPRNAIDHEELSARLSESPGARFRRVSTLAYNNTSLRENRERQTPRGPKPLIIVIPPPALLHDHGQLGHTLSQGPPHRLSHGILMPLFPTMYGQLTAIAREFNFPSTSGICIYYHFSENGLTSTPRVSDESWQFIWSHVFDERPVISPPRPPINGKIEFDIDTRQARWYASWLGSSRREPLERPLSVAPSVIQTIDHSRIESKTTVPEDFENDMIETPFPPRSRHVPKKLSLVDRFETMSARSAVGPASGAQVASPPDPASGSNHLSPIPQADEPKTAKSDLEKKVTSWRDGANLRPSPLALKGQTSLEPANMPNVVPLDEVNPPSTEDEMNLDDFTWSVSSQGPPEYDEDEELRSVSRLPSVHLAHRAQGSVCLTPSDCTSFGPFDYDIYSPVPSIERLPSPDIARRMIDDAPPTPSTVTSWGAPLSYPPSPFSEHTAFSLDIAYRAVFSRPTTPLTATSWGPPSWPASPTYYSRPPSVHLDGRGHFSRPISPVDAPMHLAGLPWPHMWPYNQRHEDVEHDLELSDVEVSVQAAPWRHVWPYVQHHEGDLQEVSTDEVRRPMTPWQHVWPYSDEHHVAEETNSTVVRRSSGIPGNAWPNVWARLFDNPHSPTTSQRKAASPRPAAVQHDLGYPYLSIYPAIYPHFDLYPNVPPQSLAPPRSAPVLLGCSRPYPLNLNEIYPSVTPQNPVIRTPNLVGNSKPYPENLYEIYLPATGPWGNSKPYPANLDEIYPHTSDRVTVISPSILIGRSRPYPLNLDEIYPPVVSKPYPANLDEIYAPLTLLNSTVGIPIVLGSAEPYPANLDEIYPSVATREFAPVSVRLPIGYPSFELYAPVYPFVTPYPPVPAAEIASTVHSKSHITSSVYPVTEIYPSVDDSELLPAISVRVDARYPAFNFYPAVYPHLDIYPAISGVSIESERPKALSVRLNSVYPSFNLYPAVYPAFNIYPALLPTTSIAQVGRNITVKIAPVYPCFNLYPAVYPSFNIYPDLPIDSRVNSPCTPNLPITLPTSYPYFNLYPPVYPVLEIYPSFTLRTRDRTEITVRLSAVYPSFNLYPPVYPYLELYPVPYECEVHSLPALSEPPTMILRPPSVVVQPPTPAPTHASHFSPITPPPPVPARRSFKLTHSELHAMVMMESSFRPIKTIINVDVEDDIVPLELPTFTPREATPIQSPPRRTNPGRRASISQPSSQAPPKLEDAPRHESVAALTQRYSSIPSAASTFGGSTLRRSVSAAHRPLPRSEQMPGLNRTRSIGLPSHPAALKRGEVKTQETSASAPMKLPKRRDSLVFQRVKAFNAIDEGESFLNLDTISEFPQPPQLPGV